MRYAALGPIEVGDPPVRIAAAKERLLMAVLLARRNQVVAVADLVETLWGDHPPRTAVKTLQTYVLHLRRIVGDALRTEPPGYVLRVEPGELDIDSFERETERGRLGLLRGDASGAARTLGRALELWRGRPFGGEDASGLAIEALRLERVRMDALEVWFEARLELADTGLSAEIEAVLEREPLRERMWGVLMRSLYSAGRQAEALRAFQRARTALIEELGVEPGPELRAVEAAVLAHDPALDSRTTRPVPQYATTGDGFRIAYWTRGDGPLEVVFCAEWVFNLELLWEMPQLRPFFERLSQSVRLTVLQRRGTGLSDRNETYALDPPQACVADVDAVVEAIGARRVALLGWGHGGQVALAYASARPDVVSCLAVVNSYARISSTLGYDAGLQPAFLEEFLTFMEGAWGSDAPAVAIFGGAAFDPELRARYARLNRLVATAREAVTIQRAVHDFDVRDLLGGVDCPALVLHLSGSVIGEPAARWLAGQLPHGEYREMPGAFIPTADEAIRVADALLAFLEAHA